MEKFDESLYLVWMYEDGYFPNFLVDKVKVIIVDVVDYWESGEHSLDDIQARFDNMTERINVLTDEFYENDSEFETVARDSIGQTVDHILKHYDIDIDRETAIRNRNW